MNKTFFQIVKAWLLVGTLDIMAAFVYYFIRSGKYEVFNVLKYVASGFFGKEAVTGNSNMIVAGFLFHYFNALCFTLLFFWLFARVKAFAFSKILTGIAYGIFIWAIMNLVVVPMSRIGTRPFNAVNALINGLILIVCIGIPLSVIANNFYKIKSTKLQDFHLKSKQENIEDVV